MITIVYHTFSDEPIELVKLTMKQAIESDATLQELALMHPSAQTDEETSLKLGLFMDRGKPVVPWLTPWKQRGTDTGFPEPNLK